jgi:transposase-like protein
MNCPSCSSLAIKRNGHIHTGKQNYRCKDCGRQFVAEPTNKIISEQTKQLIEKLLLERVSLAGICRIAEVSHVWLQNFIGQLYQKQPDDLDAAIPTPEAMAAHLEDKFDAFAYDIAALKKR